MTKPISYSDAGVSIDEANHAVAKIRNFAKSTFNEKTLTEIGSFGGMFSGMFPELKEPVLVASADGVGTKLKLAFESGIHRTIGQDLVNHCVNDILVQGAKPLFFLDYFATGKLSAETTAEVVEGISIACLENQCVLLGGETAEMPGFYSDGEYDLAGFIVGVVDRPNVIDGNKIRSGDVVIGLPTDGLQTNGFSLARKLIFEIGGYSLQSAPPELGTTIQDALMATHKSFLKTLSPHLGSGRIKGLAHITGGGFLENIPRILPPDTSVEITRGSWTEPQIFPFMQKIGDVTELEMFRTFNMGIGMVLICDKDHSDELLATLDGSKKIGLIKSGNKTVSII